MKNISISYTHTHTHTHTLPIFTPTYIVYIVYIIVTYLSSCHVRLTEEELYPNCVCISHSVMSNSCDPMDCILPGSSVHGILQSRILECVSQKDKDHYNILNIYMEFRKMLMITLYAEEKKKDTDV